MELEKVLELEHVPLLPRPMVGRFVKAETQSTKTVDTEMTVLVSATHYFNIPDYNILFANRTAFHFILYHIFNLNL